MCITLIYSKHSTHPSFSAHRAALITKTTLIFLEQGLWILQLNNTAFVVSFHSTRSHSTQVWQWHDFPGPKTNEIASFCTDKRLCKMAFFHVRQSGQSNNERFWNKKAVSSLLLYYIKSYMYINYKSIYKYSESQTVRIGKSTVSMSGWSIHFLYL